VEESMTRTNDPNPKKRDVRWPQLDLLRGIAILMVIFHHTTVEWRDVGVMGPVAYFFRWLGWSGVDLFFVLSGFLIGGLLFREIKRDKSLNVGRFIVRRAFKIWPAYFVLVAFVFAKLLHHGWTVGRALGEVAPNLMHIQNYVRNVMGQTWSLAVEEHFYLMLPLLLWFDLVRRRRARKAQDTHAASASGIDRIPAIPIAAAVLAVLCLALRCYRILWLKDLRNPTFPTEIRIDSLFFGVLLAYVFNFHPDRMEIVHRWRYLLLAAGIVLVTPPLFVSDNVRYTIGFTLLYLGYGAILIALMSVKAKTGALWAVLTSTPGRALGFIGTFSYSIFLWHMDAASWPVHHWYMMRWGQIHGAGTYCALMMTYVAVAVAMGIVMTLLVERPALWARERWWPAATGSASRTITSDPKSEISLTPASAASVANAQALAEVD
jgi:peptidoglycan/LPS O-acetylase OafA/YrhL